VPLPRSRGLFIYGRSFKAITCKFVLLLGVLKEIEAFFANIFISKEE